MPADARICFRATSHTQPGFALTCFASLGILSRTDNGRGPQTVTFFFTGGLYDWDDGAQGIRIDALPGGGR